MTVNDSQILGYIENFYHPYFNIELSEDLQTSDSVNIVLPISELQELESINNDFTHNIPVTKYTDDNLHNIISQYDETDILREFKGTCTNVIDGDTIDVKITHEIKHTFYADGTIDEEEVAITEQTKRIRLIGVNTPEPGKNGATTSTTFVSKLCLNKTVFLNIDNNKELDPYGRTLAVIIFEHENKDGDLEYRNLNKILLQERLAEIMYIPPSEFNPRSWDKTAHIHQYKNTNSDFLKIAPYINNDFSNIAFISETDNIKYVHRFEVYEGIIFLKMKPYSENLQIHIMPKSYDCSSNVLIFKDKYLSSDNVTSKNYQHSLKSFLNAYTTNTTNSNYEIHYDLRKSTQNFNNLQINAGYRYTKKTNNIFHLTGVLDNTNDNIEERCTLIDANYDKLTTYTNNIAQMVKGTTKPEFPTRQNLNIKQSGSQMNIDHLKEDEIGTKVFHKTIKYINDDLYIEEENKHLEELWSDQSE